MTTRQQAVSSHPRSHEQQFDVLGPWSLTTSRAFWEGFTPAALPARPSQPVDQLRAVFRVEADQGGRRSGPRATPLLRGQIGFRLKHLSGWRRPRQVVITYLLLFSCARVRDVAPVVEQ